MDKEEAGNTEASSNFLHTLRNYWHAYGGTSVFIRSPYLYISLVLLVITSPFWIFQKWWDQVLLIMPNVLGFTLGGLAVFLGMGDEKFKSVISGNSAEENPDSPSPYLAFSATFLHFVIVQTLSIVAALIANALMFPPPEFLYDYRKFLIFLGYAGSAFGYWLFLYGICIAVAAALAIFTMSHWYDMYQTINKKNK